MAPGRRDVCRGPGAVGTCATAQVALCKATAGHRQLVLQLGGSGDSPRLREERCRRSAEHAYPSGLRRVLLAGLRQAPASPLERQELERLWVLFLSTLELFLQDLYRAQHLCQLFSMQGGVAPLCTGLVCWGLPSRRGGRPSQPPTTQCLEEEIEQMRAMLAEMESGANIPPWTVERMAWGARGAGKGSSGGTPVTEPEALCLLALGLLVVRLPHILLVG
uniref:Uncharacterized protein n=1 Tax=Cyanoderma ruficeps TaxID=181631 RepID=A0A8C3R6W4_9PASS